MSASKCVLLILSFILLLPAAGLAQSRRELEKKRRQKEQEIKLTKKILEETRSKKKKSLSQLNLLDRQIKAREELISTVADEIIVVDGQITSESQNIEMLNGALKSLKDEYADMIYRTYKMKETGDLTSYVLSADNFNQALKRMSYVRQVGEDRDRQLQLIKNMQDSIQRKLNTLLAIKKEKNELIGIKEDEKVELKGDRDENAELVKELQQQEKELKKELEEKKKTAKKLDDQIRKLIQEEIRRAQAEEEKKNRNKKGTDKKTETKKETKSGEMALTPEAAALAKEFGANKNKLPWPVERGIVVRKFGAYTHPELKNITIVNNGIDIASVKGTQARCVFEGEVRSVFSIPGMQKAIMVKHGNYFTVYAHIDQVMVNRGDKVKGGQGLGLVYHDTEEGKTILHFEVWQNSNNLNPEHWLAGK